MANRSTTFFTSAIALIIGCGSDDQAASQSPGERIYEQTKVKAELACLGRMRDPSKFESFDIPTEKCLSLLTWGFVTNCEREAFERYPEYHELILACLERNHEELTGCCSSSGTSGQNSLCTATAIKTCANNMNARSLFCPGLPDFVEQGIANEALECAQDKGFDSVGAAILPPICGARTVCILE